MLRRLAIRSKGVVARHKDKEPALAVFEPRLIGSADAFIMVYDKARAVMSVRPGAVTTRLEKVDRVARKMRGWTTMLANDIEGFDRSMYGDNPGVPEDVLSDAETIFVVIAEHVESGGQAPDYLDEMEADLLPAIEEARAEIAAVHGTSSKLSELQAQVRQAATKFQSELVAFRRTLRAHLGSRHPDYQKLRVARVALPDEEDDEVAAALGPQGAVGDAPAVSEETEVAEVG